MNDKVKISKIRLTDNKHRFLVWLALIFMTIYIFWRIFYTIPSMEEYGVIAFICGILLVSAETISAVEALAHYHNMNNIVMPKKPEIPNEMYPDVDVLIATHNEDVDLLYKTVNGCKHMEYPDKKKVHIYICDDMNRPEMASLANRMGVGYFGLAENKEAKAGNLNNALRQTHSPYVATFDADMIPTSEFLMETVPYMLLPVMKEDENGNWVKRTEEEMDEDFKMGFIQTPQSFYNPDLFQFNFFSENRIPNEQDYFFKEINVGRNGSNAPIYAGSNTLISREALEEVDLIATNTITEDFETGIKIQSKGYTCFAIDKIVAHGLAPTDFNNLIKQRERWGRGCVASFRNTHLLLKKGLSLRGKFSYLSAFMYWFTFLRRFVYIISPILFIVFSIPVVICDVRGLLFIWLPSYILYNCALKVSSGNIRNHRWSNIVDTVIFPYLILPILAEFIHIRKKSFHVTNKNRGVTQNADYILGLPHFLLLIADIIALIIAIRDLILYQNVAGIIIIYWLIVNGVNLIMALFFIMGRKNKRLNDRFVVTLPITLYYNQREYQGETVDISDNGLAILLDDPIYIPESKDIELTISSAKYETKLQCKIAHITETKDKKWKYGLMIKEMTEEQKSEYFQIVFDRHHSLANEIGKSVSAFDDLFVNVQSRVKSNQNSIRKYPRIQVNQEIKSTNGLSVKVEDINYRYIKLSAVDQLPDEINLLIQNAILVCKKSFIRDGLYEITNYESLLENNDYVNQILTWYHQNHKQNKVA